MATNLYKQFLKLIPQAPLLVGVVQSTRDGECEIQLPDGSFTRARGSSDVGDRVWIRDGVIEGDAPNLPVELIEI